METKYFLPINSTSLAHYFGGACIKPGKYFENKPEDLQDKFNEFLLITTHFGTQQTDCCLELVFTKQETEDLIDLKSGWFLYEKPLPITRIKKIYFSEVERKEQTITNINMSTAFVPNELIEVVKGFDNPIIDNIEKPKDIYINSYTDKLKTFDSFLGGLALMRLAGEDYMNYSENYFATLSFFNENIQKDLEYSKINIDTRYQGAFTGKNGFDKVIPYLRKTIDENDVNIIAQEEKQLIKKDKITRIIDLNSLDKWTYTIAVLNSYGVGNESKKKKIDELILSNFKSDIKIGKSEGIALCYGINRGYSVFSNKYNLGKTEKVVKFQMNSQLDYYTIESLYQYAFNQTKSSSFPYLDNWCPKLKWSKISKRTDYKILDVIVIGKKKAKVLSKEYWAELLPSFLQSNKFFEKTLPQIIQELGEVLYSDTKSELEDDFENRIAIEREEKEKLKNDLLEERKKVEELQKSKTTLKEYVSKEVEAKSSVSEPIVTQQTNQDIKSIVEQVLKYKEKNQTMLKNEAKQRGIDLPKGIKQDEIIVLLMSTKDNNLFNE
ncbi:MAG TPA: hypothetical protein P5538_10515 [Bacteroidales bacterium]|nr:hypothetical protein [Bacteroidales bacterium]